MAPIGKLDRLLVQKALGAVASANNDPEQVELEATDLTDLENETVENSLINGSADNVDALVDDFEERGDDLVESEDKGGALHEEITGDVHDDERYEIEFHLNVKIDFFVKISKRKLDLSPSSLPPS